MNDKLIVKRYQVSDKPIWDAFVRVSNNGTFLFLRDYLEYHQDRFEDDSLLIKNQDEVIALLAGHRVKESYVSHGGLSYGGLIVLPSMTTSKMLAVFVAVIDYLKSHGYNRLWYKTIPSPYAKHPSEADLYALFLLKAKVMECVPWSIRDQLHGPRMQQRRLRGVSKARQHGIDVRQTDDFSQYWSLLEQLLAERHQAKPVHRLNEMLSLIRLFPEHIKLYACYLNQQMIAGILVYESEQVARFQYIAANALGRETSALDVLCVTLFDEIYANKPYIDLGSSMLPASAYVNQGLLAQKEGFGARTVVQYNYEVHLHGDAIVDFVRAAA